MHVLIYAAPLFGYSAPMRPMTPKFYENPGYGRSVTCVRSRFSPNVQEANETFVPTSSPNIPESYAVLASDPFTDIVQSVALRELV